MKLNQITSQTSEIENSFVTHEEKNVEHQNEIEEKYYHIDLLINKVMKLKLELRQTLAKRNETLNELEQVRVGDGIFFVVVYNKRSHKTTLPKEM